MDSDVDGNTYARDHYAFVRPDLRAPLYRSTGHKRDASGLASGSERAFDVSPPRSVFATVKLGM